jgi:hypothetical protein
MLVHTCNPGTLEGGQENYGFENSLGSRAILRLPWAIQEDPALKNKLYLYAMEFYSGTKKNEFLLFAGK